MDPDDDGVHIEVEDAVHKNANLNNNAPLIIQQYYSLGNTYHNDINIINMVLYLMTCITDIKLLFILNITLYDYKYKYMINKHLL